MNFSVPAPVLFSLLAAVLLPVLLVVCSHGPWTVAGPGKRFGVVAILTIAAWTAALVFQGDAAPADTLAALLILLAALIAEFTIWTLVAWGFTVTMLLALDRQEGGTSLDEWVAAYTGGRTVRAFAQDRLGVLFRFGLASQTGGQVVMAPTRGVPLAACAREFRRAFGLPT